MLVYRVDGREISSAGHGCVDSADGEYPRGRGLCDNWFTPQPPAMRSTNEIPDSILNDLLACPPTRGQATADSRFRMETMQSALSAHTSGYPQAATKFYYPAASVCFLEIIMEGRLVVKSN